MARAMYETGDLFFRKGTKRERKKERKRERERERKMVQVIRELFKRVRGTEKKGRSSLLGGSPSSIPLENACRRKHNRPCTMDYVPNTRRNPCSSVKTDSV